MAITEMPRSPSALELKMRAAALREFKHECRERRDDGVVRRSTNDPLTIEGERERSRNREFNLSSPTRYYLEMAKRARIARRDGHEGGIAAREVLVREPVPAFAPGSKDANLERFRHLSKRQRRMLGI